MNARIEQTILDKLRQLPPERLAEVEDFVDFLRTREGDRALTQAAQQAGAVTGEGMGELRRCRLRPATSSATSPWYLPVQRSVDEQAAPRGHHLQRGLPARAARSDHPGGDQPGAVREYSGRGAGEGLGTSGAAQSFSDELVMPPSSGGWCASDWASCPPRISAACAPRSINSSASELRLHPVGRSAPAPSPSNTKLERVDEKKKKKQKKKKKKKKKKNV